MSALLACGAVTLLLLVYIFYPERQVTAQRGKTRLEYLRERRDTLYDNLRDLQFEHRAGKYGEEEYAHERGLLEAEAVEVVAEMERATPPLAR